VVGGGDSACDEASYLANLTDHLVMIHRRDRFRAQKALADRVLKNPRIEVRFNQELQEISGESRVRRVRMKNTHTGNSVEEDFDAVFIFIGSVPRAGLVPDLPRDGGGYILTDQNMESPLKGLFAVGDVRATPFRQVVVACGEGAVAAHMAAAHIEDVRGRTRAEAV
jgi:thioredoxin reductase (NADPH)